MTNGLVGRQHLHDDVAFPVDLLRVLLRESSCGLELFHLLRNHVVTVDFEAGFPDDIFYHGKSHYAETEETDGCFCSHCFASISHVNELFYMLIVGAIPKKGKYKKIGQQ